MQGMEATFYDLCLFRNMLQRVLFCKGSMSFTPWSLSSALLLAWTGLCLFPQAHALHALTKTILAPALCQLLRLDGQLQSEKGPGRSVTTESKGRSLAQPVQEM